MELTTSLIVFVTIIISVNNFVLYWAMTNRIHSKTYPLGLQVFLISVVEIVAIGIWGYIHLRK
jgi:membrane protein YdbS with pleckstrin-like domain